CGTSADVRLVLADRRKRLHGLSGARAVVRPNLSSAGIRRNPVRPPDVARRPDMSSISTLLTRNLQDVFGENDPVRRRAAIDEIYTEDVVFYEQPSKNVYRGRDEIDRIAGALRAKHPDFRYQPITQPEEVGNG